MQESFVDYHDNLLFRGLEVFNRTLADWLVFYDTERLHYALNMLSSLLLRIHEGLDDARFGHLGAGTTSQLVASLSKSRFLLI